jgi:Rrf2 family transcriptional regulator, nitric oxide-sensitive transcriptional repressor
MRLTQFTDFALRTLIYLGLQGDRLSSIHEIAQAYGISENHLTKVVHLLGQQGFIDTLRGRGGGVRLARPAAQIRVGDVVRRTEEDMALVACFPGSGSCILTGACGGQPALHEALAAFFAVLDKYTLEDMIQTHQKPMRERLGVGGAPGVVKTPT